MRIVFVDIQNSNVFLIRELHTIIFRDRIPIKYTHIFQELLKHNDVEVCNYITSKGSSLFSQCNVHVSLPKWISFLEYRIASRLNGIKTGKIRILTEEDEIRQDDIIITFIHAFAAFTEVNCLKGKKLLHLNQYNFHPISIIRENKFDVVGYIAEADLLKSKGLFSDNCSTPYPKMLRLPFCVGERFKKIKKFSDRNNKAIAIGTLGMCKYSDFVNYYHSEYLQPMRHLIYESGDSLKEYMDSYIFPYNEYKDKYWGATAKNIFIRLYKLFFALTHPKQKQYFSFNIVDKFNDYRMSIIGEEVIGLPGIAAFESMACGCALLALDHDMYHDIGMIPGIHYIAYDGTLESLKDKIAYYQSAPDELEKVAENGCDFVHKYLNAKTVTNLFVKQLQNL